LLCLSATVPGLDPGAAGGRLTRTTQRAGGLLFSDALAADPGPARGRRGVVGLLDRDCFSSKFSPQSPGPARGRRDGVGLLDRDCFSSKFSLQSPGPARERREGSRRPDLDSSPPRTPQTSLFYFYSTYSTFPLPPPSPPSLPSAFAAVPWPRSRVAGWGRTAGPGLLFCVILAAVPGPVPGMAGGGADCWTWTAPRPPRARGAFPLPALLQPLHTFTHHLTPPSPSLCTFIIILPAAIVQPQGFLVRGFPPRRAAGVHSHLTLSHASHHPTNLSDSPPAWTGTCCLSPLAQETPSEPPR
jgi:hypothetical protein